jgi:hypothetical protein
MAGDNPALLINEHGVVEAKPLDAFRDLPDLPLGMGARVALVGSQRFDRNSLDVHSTSYPFKASVGRFERVQASRSCGSTAWTGVRSIRRLRVGS